MRWPAGGVRSPTCRIRRCRAGNPEADGILEGAHDGLVTSTTTRSLETARYIAERLAEHGIPALDAPVSGGDIGARNGTLTIMVGGPMDAFERAKPLFEAMGKTITWIGESGAGQIAKAANQIVVAGTMVAMGEALVLAQKAGVDPARVVQAISRGSAMLGAGHQAAKAVQTRSGARLPAHAGKRSQDRSTQARTCRCR